mgnify:CR=1 FL=1
MLSPKQIRVDKIMTSLGYRIYTIANGLEVNMQSSVTKPSGMVENQKSEKFMGVRGNNAEFKKLCRAPVMAWPTAI